MRLSDIRGRAVVDVNDSKKLGELSDVLLDPTTRKPVAIKLKSGLFSQSQTIPIDQLKSVGPDAITVALQGAATSEGQQTDTAPATPPLHDSIEASSIQGNKVITDTGTLIGEVQNLLLDPATLEITGYEVKGGGLFTRPQEITITPDVRHGDDIITVPATLLG